MSANNFQLTLDTLAPKGSISPSSLTAYRPARGNPAHGNHNRRQRGHAL